MNILIVCYSMSGNVFNVCTEIAGVCGADVLRVEPEKTYPDKGMKKFLWGGKSALMGEKPPLKPYETDLGSYDAVVIGYPVWASTYPPPIASFIEAHKEELKEKEIGAVACFAGSGGAKSLSKLKNALDVDAFFATALVQDSYPKKADLEAARKESIRTFAETLKNKTNEE